MHKVVLHFTNTNHFEEAGRIVEKMTKDVATLDDYRAFHKIYCQSEPRVTYKRDARRGGYGPKEPKCRCGHKRSQHYRGHGSCNMACGCAKYFRHTQP
jgi:hypothetical protein